MFKLVYRDGAPENTGHYEVFNKATGTSKALTVGQLVSVANGVASKYVGGKPYGVVAINAADGEDEVVVLRITDEMIFRVGTKGMTTTIAETVKKCVKCIVTDDSVTSTGDGPFEITEIVKEGTADADGYAQGMILEGRFTSGD